MAYGQSLSYRWLEDPVRRVRVEAGARRNFRSLRYRHRQRRSGPFDIWSARVEVNGYEDRLVTVEFDRKYPISPRVFADGPTDSPHRYPHRGGRALCLWFPSDPADRRWVPADGLQALFGLAAHHLFKEAWWRETGGYYGGEWLGDEAPHNPAGSTDIDEAATEATHLSKDKERR